MRFEKVTALAAGTLLAAGCSSPFLHNIPDIPEPTAPVPCETLAAAMGATVHVSPVTGAQLTWQSQAGDTYQMRVESASSASGPWTTVAVLPGTAREWLDADCVVPNSACYYRVQGFNNDCSAPASNTAAAFTAPIPPTGVAAANSGDGFEISVSWTDPNSYETGTIIERAAGTSGAFAEVARVPTDGASTPNDRTWADSGLDPDSQFTYRVSAYVDYPSDPDAVAAGGEASAWTAPATPTDLATDPVSATRINLTWTDVATTETEYVVEHGTSDAGPWFPQSLSADAASASVTGLSGGVHYYFRVTATNGDLTPALSSTAVIDQLTLPNRPANFTAAPASSGDGIDLTWDDPTPTGTATGFHLERLDVPGGTVVDEVDVLGDVFAFTDSPLAASTHYYYRAFTINAAGSSAAATDDAWTGPPSPTGLTATPITDTEIDLDWTDAAAGLATYNIEAGPSAGSLSEIAGPLLEGTHGYNATGLSPNSHVYFRVVAVAGPLTSGATANAWTFPEPVTALTAAPTALGNAIQLTWTNPASGAPAFRLERRIGDQSGSPESALDPAGPSPVTQSSLLWDTHYFFKVFVVNAAGDSLPTLASTWTVPATPTGLTVTAPTGSDTKLDLAWTDNSAGARPFLIYRQDSGAGPFNLVHTTADGVVVWQDTGLTPGTQYTYHLVARNAQPGPVNYDSLPSANVGDKTRVAPTVAWGAGPSFSADALCDLTVPGVTTYDTHYTAAFASATGSMGALCTADTPVDDAGLSCRVTDKTRRSGTTTWAVTDDHGLTSSTATRALTLRFATTPASTYLTALAAPVAPLVRGGDAMPGRQVWFPPYPSAPTTTCGTCEGPRGSLAMRTSGGCVLSGAGGVACWGAATNGQLGDGGVGTGTLPVGVCASGSGPACPRLVGVEAITSGGTHSCALMSNGGVKCWGNNSSGQLGNPLTGASSSLPVDVCMVADCSILLQDTTAIVAGTSHTCAISFGSDSVVCWGDGGTSQLGTGDGLSYNRATSACATGSVDGGSCTAVNGAVAIAAGGAHSCVLMADGSVRCWGGNGSGQLGDGTTSLRPNPVPVCPAAGCPGTLTGIVGIVAGNAHTCGITTTGDAVCWGDNGSGQLGDGTTTGPVMLPTDVCLTGSAPCTTKLRGVRALAAGASHTCALIGAGDVGDLYCWGAGAAGQLGTGDAASYVLPTTVCATGSITGADCVARGGAVSVATGNNTACAASRQNGVWCWGSNTAAALGDGGDVATQRDNPVDVCDSGSGPGCGGGTAMSGAAMAVCGALEVVP